MVKSKNGQSIVAHIPKGQLLTETDGPYLKIENRPAQPADVRMALEYASRLWNTSISEAEKQVEENYKEIISFTNLST
jgi:TatD DNase family protein